LKAQVTQLQERADAHARVWGTLCRGGLAILMSVAAAVLFVTAFWLEARQFGQMVGFQLLFASIPLRLFAQALRMH
jgi:hypothetical protein